MTERTGDMNEDERREFDAEMGDPDRFNDCTCDAWPDGSPHRHVGALVEP